MINLLDLMKSLESFTVFNDKYYKILDLEKSLKDVKEITLFDYILTLYYIHDNRRLELYAYELNIRAVEEPNFEKHIMNITGQKDICKIPQTVIDRQKICYIEKVKNKEIVLASDIQNYINYLFDDKELFEQINQCFGTYDTEEFYFEIF